MYSYTVSTRRGYTASRLRSPRSDRSVGLWARSNGTHCDVEHWLNVLTVRHLRKHRAVIPHRSDEAVPVCCNEPGARPTLCRSVVLAAFVMCFMPSTSGYVLPLEFKRGASSNYPPFGVPAASAHDPRKGWRRQAFGSTSNEDTISASPLSASGSGEGSATTGTHFESLTFSGVDGTSSRTAARTTQLNPWTLTPTRTNSFAVPLETPSPSDTRRRTFEFSKVSIPPLVTGGRPSSTTERRGSSSDLSPSTFPSSSISTVPRIPVQSTPNPSSAVSRTSPIRTVPHSYSSLRYRPPVFTYRSSSSSRSLSASDSVTTSNAILVTSFHITTTIWISVPTTISITVTASIPPSIPPSIPTTASATMSTSSPPLTLSSLPTALSWIPPSSPSDPTILPGSVSSSSALLSTSFPSSATASLSPSFSASSSSGSVLEQPTTSSTTTTIPITRTTLFTTVVKTSIAVGGGGQTNTRTSTAVVSTGTLKPHAGGGSNIFALNKGALAGLIVGCIALAALVAAWVVFAYRRHRARSAQNADAVSALRSGPGRPRALLLDEDDDGGHTGGMAFHGSRPVSRASEGARYALLHEGNNLAGAAFCGALHRPDVARGASIAMSRRSDAEMEDVVLVHPTNWSDVDVAAAGMSNGSSPGSQARSSVGKSSSGVGPEPGAWLGGQVVSSPNATIADYFSGTRHERPTSPSSVYSDGVMSAHPDSHSIRAAMSAYMGGWNSYESSSSHGHDAAGLPGGHSSSNDDKNCGSSSGDAPSTTTHSSQLLLPRPVPVSAPSSLLPTKTAPPTSSRGLGESVQAGRKSSFLGRSLRSLRLRSASTGPLPVAAAGTSALVGPGSGTKGQAPHDPSPAHLRPPTLSPVPPPPSHSGPVITEAAAASHIPGSGSRPLGIHVSTASGAPVWHGLGSTVARSSAPSPALTEGSTRAPDGLLNPQWVNGDGMRSQGAISFRDDMDYSRPIGGWVNNRQHSSTSLETMSSAGPLRRGSHESDRTDDTYMQAAPVPPHARGARGASEIRRASMAGAID